MRKLKRIEKLGNEPSKLIALPSIQIEIELSKLTLNEGKAQGGAKYDSEDERARIKSHI